MTGQVGTRDYAIVYSRRGAGRNRGSLRLKLLGICSLCLIIAHAFVSWK